MKKIFSVIITVVSIVLMNACNNTTTSTSGAATTGNEQPANAGQANVQDNSSMKDIVKVAVNSPDHTTLVKALKQAELVDVLANPGPFTVFAPTNAAFDKLTKGTFDGLMKNEKKADLQNILQYHVTTSSLPVSSFTDGQTIGMVNGDNITVQVKDGKVILNNSATIVASIQASNGMVHVIDGVLLPPAKNNITGVHFDKKLPGACSRKFIKN
jgi:uncharacterized surface protein with fasciclin (FAS1) repeats